MEKDSNRLKINIVVGLIIIVILVFIGYLYFGFVDHYKKYTLYTHESIHGMVITSPVEYRGVKIGEVLKIDLEDSLIVRIIIGIKKSIPVTANTTATIITRGLASSGFTGYVYISLDNLDSIQPPLVAQKDQTYPEIKVISPQSNSMDLNLSEVLIKVSKVEEIIEGVFDNETQASLKKLIKNLEKITHTLAVNNRLNSFFINAQKLSGQINPLLLTGNRALVMAETQILPELYQALINFNNLSVILNNLTNKIDRDPSIVIRGIRPTQGPGESH